MILVFTFIKNGEVKTVEISFYTVSNFRNETIYHSDAVDESIMEQIKEGENVSVRAREEDQK